MTARPPVLPGRARDPRASRSSRRAVRDPAMGNHQPPGRWPRPLLDRGPRRTQGHEVPSPRISAWHRRRTAEPARAAPGTPAPQADPQRPHRTPTPHAPLDNTTSISAARGAGPARPCDAGRREGVTPGVRRPVIGLTSVRTSVQLPAGMGTSTPNASVPRPDEWTVAGEVTHGSGTDSQDAFVGARPDQPFERKRP